MRGAGLVDSEGKPRFTPHALRHAAVALLHENGVPLLEIARIVGHKALDLTIGTYAYIFTDAEDRATPAMTAAYEALVPTKTPQVCDSRGQEGENVQAA
jgi:integrase